MPAQKWNSDDLSRDALRQRKRDAVLQAGVRLFNERGYDRTSLEDIAKALNITKRTIYYYVQSKEDILFECNRLGIEFLAKSVAGDAVGSLPAPDRIRAQIEAYIDWVCTEFGACLVLTDLDVLSPERRAVLQESRNEVDASLRLLIEQGVADGSLKPVDARLATAAIFGALNWLAHWNRGAQRVEVEALKATYTRLFFDGILKNGV